MSNLPKGAVFCMYIRNICLVFLSMFFMIDSQSFATGIPATDGEAQPADCDNDTLDTTSGTANLRADFEANRIDLRWYDSNTLLNVSSTSSDKCIYDTTIDLPTNPTKTGYTFKGWKVRPEYDFSTLNASILGTTGKSKNANGECLGTSDTEDCTSTHSDLNNNEWKVQYSYGTVYGMSLCSSTNTEYLSVGTPNESSAGVYCWCKATGYIPNGSSVKYAPSHKMSWVSLNSNGENCPSYCARRCQPMQSVQYRQALFGQSAS